MQPEPAAFDPCVWAPSPPDLNQRESPHDDVTVIDVAIVGAGLMGRWHAHAAQRAGARVTAVLDTDPERVQSLAAKCAGAKMSSAWDPHWIAEHARVAHVCTPLDTHEAMVAGLLSVGVSVLCEKPLTDDAGSTARLLDLAKKHGAHLCPVHQMPFQDGVTRLRNELTSIGPVLHVEFAACTAGASNQGDEAHDGLIADVLPHPLSLLWALGVGPAATLDWTTLHPRAGEMRAMAIAGRSAVSFAISTHGRPTANRFRVIGERGTFDADLYHGFAALSRGRVSRSGKVLQPFADAANTFARAGVNLANRAIHQEPAYPGLAALVAAFYGAVNGDGPPPISAEQVLDIAAARDVILTQLRERL